MNTQELIERLEKDAETFRSVGLERFQEGDPLEAWRLLGKADGVAFALSRVKDRADG